MHKIKERCSIMFKVFEEIMDNFDGFSNLKLNAPGYAPWIKNGNTLSLIHI